MAWAFTVLGIPIPKGSTKAFLPKGWKRPVTTADNKNSKPWQEAVLNAAVDVLGDEPPLEGGVALSLRFYLPRPKSAPKRLLEQTKKPDLDKLIRCVKDGLTRAGVYRDDSQVITVLARKDFAGGAYDPRGDRGIPRVEVLVTPTTEIQGTGDLFAAAASGQAGGVE